MPETLTIRNLTPQPLTLKLIERYEVPAPPSSSNGFSVSNFTSSLLGNATTSANRTTTLRAELANNAASFAQQDVDLRMEAFSTHPTEIKLTERHPNDILRLTLEGDGGARWRIDVPTPSMLSQALLPLTPDPGHDYCGIYLADSALLSLHERPSDPQSWMQHFRPETPLSALSIPGTHNSPTCHKALPSVRCQAVSPLEQLRHGIRFFDIRVQPGNPSNQGDDTLYLVHGAFPISLTGPKKFRPLVEEMHAFLRDHPSETIIMSLKREGTGNATDAQLAWLFREHYARDDDRARWFTEPRVPSLGEARGKIVLLRRFGLDERLKGEWEGRGWALNAENWEYNTANCHCGDVCVQDFCEVLETVNIDKKIGLCCDHFERAAAVVCPPLLPEEVRAEDAEHAQSPPPPPPPAGPLYLNFLSASNFWRVGCWPEKIAARLNPAVTAFLCERHDVGDKGADGPGQAFDGDGGVGVVVCDWVGRDGDWDLVHCIVSMNGRLLLRQGKDGWR